jgi:hydrophobic/amphiphilic exporter-1 (mainly G- bacteria), HAE1 family
MRRLAEICIHRPVFAAMLILAMVVVGAASYYRLGVDRLPSVDLPTVSIRTTLPGASPEEVETEVSQKIEEVVNTVEGIDELRSISGTGSSIVIATFNLSRDIDAATQDIRDRVSTVLRRLPDNVDPPVVSKFDNDSSPVMTLALSGERPVRELTELADKLVKTELERSKGVGEINIVGELERAVNVWVDADKLAAHNIPITAVRDAVVRQNAEVPGGNVTGAEQEQVLRTLGRLQSPEAFNDVVIAYVSGTPVRVRDIGRAEDGTKEQRSVSRLNGKPSVQLQVRRQSGANTVEVINSVKNNLASVQAQIPPGVNLEIIRDQSQYIDAALHEINVHLVLGSILACLVVLFFMRDWRSTIIAGVAIPASVSTFAMMEVLGFTLNSVTMLALVLMVGIVIDDAIVVLENIFRFVEEKKMSPMRAAVEGTGEIALAVLATTLSLVVIFIPFSFMSSISGRFLYQFGLTAAVAVMVSLLVSFTLTPMMSSRMLKKLASHSHEAQAHSRAGFNALIDRFYTAMLRFVMRFRWPVAVVALAVMSSSVWLYGHIRQDYLPSDVDEAEFEVRVTAPQRISFTAMNDVMKQIEQEVIEMPQVRTVLSSAGGSFLGSVNTGEMYVRIAPHEERYFSLGRLWRELKAGKPMDAFKGNYSQRDVMNEIRAKLRKYKDLRPSVRNYPAFNIGGGNFDIDFIVRGPELEKIAEYTEHLRRKVASEEIPGIVDADVTLKLDKPELRVNIDRELAADQGVTSQDLGTALRLMVGGDDEITRFRDRQTNEDYDVELRLMAKDRTNPEELPRLLLAGSGNKLVELRSIATIETAEAPARIDRLNRQRAGNLRAGVKEGYALADRLEALRAEVEMMDLPPAYSVTVAGRGRELERTFKEFLIAFALSIVFMYMILAANYESLIHPVTILVSLPLSVPFALLSLWAMDGTLNLYSALGILVLFGVVKKNAILQIDHMNHLRNEGMERYAAIIQANRDRLRPILMTTLALVGGMLPLALGTGPGAEERRAVAIVVIGGQTLSLLLTLLVTPVAYSLLDDLGAFIRRRKLQDHHAGMPRVPVGASRAGPDA